MQKILVGDIGGTHCRFGTFLKGQKGKLRLIDMVSFSTSDFSSIQQVFENLEEISPKMSVTNFKIITLGVPGPVIAGRHIRMAHIAWTINPNSVRKKYNQIVFNFIHDYTAQAYGCLTEAVSSAIKIKAGKTTKGGDIGIIGAGTGLGYGVLKSDYHGGYIPIQSEAGHATFPFMGDDEFNYRKFVIDKTGQTHISYDMMVSGQGLSFLYEYFNGTHLAPEDVVKNIRPESETRKWFSRFYARACRNFCLSLLYSPSALYLSGGIPAKNIFLVDNPTFRREFIESPEKKDLLRYVPIFLNINEQIGLWGAALYTYQKLSTSLL
jgi:glucokinase